MQVVQLDSTYSRVDNTYVHPYLHNIFPDFTLQKCACTNEQCRYIHMWHILVLL